MRFPTQVGAASPGALQFVNVAGVNAATRKTSGVDFVAQYRTSLDQFMGGLNMNARLAYTRMIKGYIVPLPGAPKDPYVGEIGAPKNKANATIAFHTDKVGVSFNGTYIGESLEDNVFLENLGFGPKTIKIKPVFYLDSQVSFTPSKTYEFFVGVDNALNKKAPSILSGTPFNVTGSDTAAGTYDIFGRRYYAGARLRF